MISEHAAMVARLVESGDLTGVWRPAVEAVERHAFLPDWIWADDPDGLRPVGRSDDPNEWLRRAYADDYVVVQADDGMTPPGASGEYLTATMSAPAAVTIMLDRLDVQPGESVLEIGTGTGYNTALLAYRLGGDHVVSVEIDPAVAATARANLARHPHTADVVVHTGDGGTGFTDRAPYDRVLATVAAQRVPYAWVEQTRPGGFILTPWGTSYENGALAELHVAADGKSASGRFGESMGFMWMRAQRTASTMVSLYVTETEAGESSISRLHPYEPVGLLACSFAVGLQLPGVLKRVIGHGEQNHATVWLIDPDSRSWARIDTTPELADRIPVRQYGPRRLWDEVERAHAQWVSVGRPEHTDFGLTVDVTGQQVWLRELGNRIDWATLTASGNSSGVDAALVAELARRVEADQAVRADDAPQTDDHYRQWEAVDQDNTIWLKGIVAVHGWLGRRLVGDDGAHDAWLLAQHADRDPDFQKRCVALLRDAVQRGDAAPIDLAYLIDRVRRADRQPQLYGTQYEAGPDGRWQPQPIESSALVNERRALIGMNPIEDDYYYQRPMATPQE